MMKKAILLDLDNTVYPVSSIGDKLFHTLFELIKSRGEYSGDFSSIRSEIMRKPFQLIAKKFSFSESLLNDGMEILKDLTFEEPMDPFEDYKEIQNCGIDKYLITVGFTKMQWSKIKQLNIEKDFRSIYVIDPIKSDLTKKDIFLKILKDDGYKASDLIVVGDDLDSEIKAGTEAGIDTVLYDREGIHSGNKKLSRISSFKELTQYLRGEN